MAYKYAKVTKDVADRLGITSMRRTAGDYVILSEGDLKMIDLSFEEKVEFFGGEVLTEAQALALISGKIQPEESDTPSLEEESELFPENESNGDEPESVITDVEIEEQEVNNE